MEDKTTIPNDCYEEWVRDKEFDEKTYDDEKKLMEDIIGEGIYKIIPAGTILYTGSRIDSPHKKYEGPVIDVSHEDTFKYRGQSGKKDFKGNYISYFSTDINTARGYAINEYAGWINKFIVKKDVPIYVTDTFEDAPLIDKCICNFAYINKQFKKPEIAGLGVLYDNLDPKISQKNEYAICNSWNYMEYIGTTVISGSDIKEFKKIFNIIPEQKGGYNPYYYKYRKYKSKYINLKEK